MTARQHQPSQVSICTFFPFLYFRLITSKFLYFQCEARCSENIESRLFCLSRCLYVIAGECMNNQWIIFLRESRPTCYIESPTVQGTFRSTPSLFSCSRMIGYANIHDTNEEKVIWYQLDDNSSIQSKCQQVIFRAQVGTRSPSLHLCRSQLRSHWKYDTSVFECVGAYSGMQLHALMWFEWQWVCEYLNNHHQ